jgi:uncharacterized delta-60 repeat protein
MPELGIFLGAITNRAYGYTTPAIWNFNGNVYAITPEVDPSTNIPTGKIYVGGAFTTYNDITVNRIVKLNIDGTIDTSFNTGRGFNSTANVNNTWGSGAALAVYTILQESGSNKIYVCGAFTNYSASVSVNRIIRLNSNGTLDNTFTSGITGYGSFGYLHTICHASGSDKIYVGGRTLESVGCIARLNSNGAIDTDFNTGTGNTKGFFSLLSSAVYSIIQASGSDKIYVGGNFTQYSGSAAASLSANYIARLNSNGTRDLTFSASLSGFVYTLAQESGSDKIYAGGTFADYANSNAAVPNYNNIPRRLIRLNSNGSRDTSFLAGIAGGMTGSNSSIHRIIQVPNSTDIYLGGFFESYTTGSRSFTQNRISRLTSTASTSSLANFGTGFDNNTVYALAPSGSNGLYVGGAFTSYQGSSANYFIKLIPSS